MPSSTRARIISAVCGIVLAVVGVVWLLISGPGPFGHLFLIAGIVIALGPLINWWIYRDSKSDKTL